MISAGDVTSRKATVAEMCTWGMTGAPASCGDELGGIVSESFPADSPAETILDSGVNEVRLEAVEQCSREAWEKLELDPSIAALSATSTAELSATARAELKQKYQACLRGISYAEVKAELEAARDAAQDANTEYAELPKPDSGQAKWAMQILCKDKSIEPRFKLLYGQATVGLNEDQLVQFDEYLESVAAIARPKFDAMTTEDAKRVSGGFIKGEPQSVGDEPFSIRLSPLGFEYARLEDLMYEIADMIRTPAERVSVIALPLTPELLRTLSNDVRCSTCFQGEKFDELKRDISLLSRYIYGETLSRETPDTIIARSGIVGRKIDEMLREALKAQVSDGTGEAAFQAQLTRARDELSSRYVVVKDDKALWVKLPEFKGKEFGLKEDALSFDEMMSIRRLYLAAAPQAAIDLANPDKTKSDGLVKKLAAAVKKQAGKGGTWPAGEGSEGSIAFVESLSILAVSVKSGEVKLDIAAPKVPRSLIEAMDAQNDPQTQLILEAIWKDVVAKLPGGKVKEKTEKKLVDSLAGKLEDFRGNRYQLMRVRVTEVKDNAVSIARDIPFDELYGTRAKNSRIDFQDRQGIYAIRGSLHARSLYLKVLDETKDLPEKDRPKIAESIGGQMETLARDGGNFLQATATCKKDEKGGWVATVAIEEEGKKAPFDSKIGYTGTIIDDDLGSFFTFEFSREGGAGKGKPGSFWRATASVNTGSNLNYRNPTEGVLFAQRPDVGGTGSELTLRGEYGRRWVREASGETPSRTIEIAGSLGVENGVAGPGVTASVKTGGLSTRAGGSTGVACAVTPDAIDAQQNGVTEFELDTEQRTSQLNGSVGYTIGRFTPAIKGSTTWNHTAETTGNSVSPSVAATLPRDVSLTASLTRNSVGWDNPTQYLYGLVVSRPWQLTSGLLNGTTLTPSFSYTIQDSVEDALRYTATNIDEVQYPDGTEATEDTEVPKFLADRSTITLGAELSGLWKGENSSWFLNGGLELVEPGTLSMGWEHKRLTFGIGCQFN